jgi:hypothetical protein
MEPGCVMHAVVDSPPARGFGRRCRAKLAQLGLGHRLCFLPEGFACPAL